VPVVALSSAEGAALGGAIQAARTLGKGSYEALCERVVRLDESSRCEPRAEAAEIYRAKLEEMTSLTTLLRDGGRL